MEQIFSERQRKVFQYHNGRELVWGDPRKIHCAIVQFFDGDPRPTFEQAASAESAIAIPAQLRQVEAVRVAFGMVPFDPATGEGATDEDCLEALSVWSAFMAAKKKSGETRPS